MAREIVITSVPRGVKLGRTGFQVAMQTAGIRDDVAAALEKMAGYRHLPAGGANPICYFHRIARTVAGQLHVIGRTVDAGVDFSNRSNKLAHMVVIEPGELGAVAQSSPAAALAAVEPRLATVWTAGPEERQAPFGLDGIPPSLPAVCTAWQQAMGDAGWAGVIAERALQKQPTLIVGTDPSPESCRRMLGLFREALAIVPANRRWEITFDTTTLSADGVLWRGTYAGSPESQSTQPGLLVIDLSRPQPIPANMMVGELVQAARTGRGPSAPTPVAPGGSIGHGGPVAPVTPVGPVAPGVPGRPAKRPGVTQKPGEQTPDWIAPRGPSTGPTPPPPPDDDLDVPDVVPRKTRGPLGRILAVVIPLSLFLIVGLAGVGGVVVWQAMAPRRALATIQAYADSSNAAKPSAADVCVALRFAADSPDAKKVEDHHKFLTAVLASEEVTAKDVASADDLRGLLDGIAALTNEGWTKTKIPYGSLGVSLDETAANLLAEIHPKPFIDYREFHDWAVACRDLAVLATTEPADRGNRQVEPVLWAELVAKAKAKAKADDKEPRDYANTLSDFSKNVSKGDLKSLATLLAAVDRYAPVQKQPEPKPEQPGPEQTAGGGEKPATPAPMPEPQKPPEAPKDPAAAFKALLAAMEAFKKSGKAAWPPDQAKGLELFSIPADLTDDLDVDVVVGTREEFKPTIARDGTGPAWKISLGSDCLARLTIEGGKVVLRRGEAPDQVWDANKNSLQSMPIAFKRAGIPDLFWFVPSPASMRLKATDTLHDLLCSTEGTVKPPEPVAPLPGVTPSFRLRTGRITVPGSPLTFDIDPVADNKVALAFTATVDGKPYTLTEPMSFNPATGQLTRERGPWTERESRLKRFPATTTTELELAKMGIRPAKAPEAGWTFEPINLLNKNGPIVVRSVLSDIGMLGDPAGMMEAWVPDSSKPATGGKDDKKLSLGAWRESIQKYVAGMGHPFGVAKGAAYEQAHQKPADPGKFSEPDRKKDEKDKDYNDRVAQARRDYEGKKVPWDTWHAERDKACRDAAADREQIRQFLVAHPVPADADPKKPDPERAAIHFLLELDSLIVAKTHRDALEELLTRVPVAALVEGETTAAGWSLQAVGDSPLPVTVPVRLLAADVKPAPDKSPAPAPASPGDDDGQQGGSAPAAEPPP